MECRWDSATPAAAGVYAASTEGDMSARRHWDGTHWSAPWYVGDPPEIIARACRTLAESPRDIRWVLPAEVSAA